MITRWQCLAVLSQLSRAAPPVIILDFDDTIFPTSHYLEASRLEAELDMPSSVPEQVAKLIAKAESLGEVLFLTASCPDTRWMFSLVDDYYSIVAPKMRSLRTFYSRHHNGATKKLESFVEIIDLYGRERVYISISDSPMDHYHFELACLTNVSCKAVHMAYRPTVIGLYMQLQCLTESLDSITAYNHLMEHYKLEFPGDSRLNPFAQCVLTNMSASSFSSVHDVCATHAPFHSRSAFRDAAHGFASHIFRLGQHAIPHLASVRTPYSAPCSVQSLDPYLVLDFDDTVFPSPSSNNPSSKLKSWPSLSTE